MKTASSMLLVACFLSSNVYSVEEYTDNHLDASSNVEFETMLARYATHSPFSNYALTSTAAMNTLEAYCTQKKLPHENCKIVQVQDNLESLLSGIYYSKLQLSRVEGSSIAKIDEALLRMGIRNLNDDYAHVEETEIRVVERYEALKSDSVRIENFDSSKGCKAEKQLSVEYKIIDLRGNLGGDITCTMKALEKVLPKGNHHIATLYTRSGVEQINVLGTRANDLSSKAIHVDEITASSAEIFANALISNGWEVVGLPMKGKRTIQAKYDSIYGAYFLTIGEFTVPGDHRL